MSSGVSDQVRLKLACSATDASMRLEILVIETRDITLSRQRTTKALIRLRGSHGPAHIVHLLPYIIRRKKGFNISKSFNPSQFWNSTQIVSPCVLLINPK